MLAEKSDPIVFATSIRICIRPDICVFHASGRNFDITPRVIPRGVRIKLLHPEREGGVASGGLVGVRYVLIPDGMPAKMSADFWKDYEAVAEYFGIPE